MKKLPITSSQTVFTFQDKVMEQFVTTPSKTEKKLHLSVDVVVFSLQNQKLCTLVLEEEHLICSTVDTSLDTSLEVCAKRAVKEKLGVDLAFIEQVQTIGDAQRSPQFWAVSVVYYGLIAHSRFDTKLLRSVKIKPLQHNTISFDQSKIIESCYQRLHNKALYTTLPIFLLAQEFTLTEVQRAYEAVLGFKIEKKSFRRRMLEAGVLRLTGNIRRASHRPALLYQLAKLTPYYFSRVIQGGREKRPMAWL